MKVENNFVPSLQIQLALFSNMQETASGVFSLVFETITVSQLPIATKIAMQNKNYHVTTFIWCILYVNLVFRCNSTKVTSRIFSYNNFILQTIQSNHWKKIKTKTKWKQTMIITVIILLLGFKLNVPRIWLLKLMILDSICPFTCRLSQTTYMDHLTSHKNRANSWPHVEMDLKASFSSPCILYSVYHYLVR